MMFTGDDRDRPPSRTTIRTVSGTYIDLLDPHADDIIGEDIAHALSMTCRYGGHVAQFYSVAEHSMHVSTMVLRETGDLRSALAGLLHDAAEAYLGDIVGPLKRTVAMAPYREIEANLERVIADAFDLPSAGVGSFDDPAVKHVDKAIRAWEMAMFRDARWRTPTQPELVREAFVDHLDSIYSDMREGLAIMQGDDV